MRVGRLWEIGRRFVALAQGSHGADSECRYLLTGEQCALKCLSVEAILLAPGSLSTPSPMRPLGKFLLLFAIMEDNADTALNNNGSGGKKTWRRIQKTMRT